MASRNLTSRFVAERDHWRALGGDLVHIKVDVHGEDDRILARSEAARDDGPVWIDIVHDIEVNLADIARGSAALAALHTQRLKVGLTE